MDNQQQVTNRPARCVIENIPKVGFYHGGPRPPEDDPFPACLRAWLEYRGESLGFDAKQSEFSQWHSVHCYNMGTSGAAFRLSWDAHAWDMSASDIMLMAEDPVAGFRRAMEAAGYACDILLKRDFARMRGLQQEQDYSEDDFRERIMHSIHDLGRPVFAFGVIGPPECGLITGYDEQGDVLIGWSFFQDEPSFNAGVEFEESQYYRKRNWFADTCGLILIGDEIERPAPRDIYCKALQAGLDIMRTPMAHGLQQGQAAFTLWADTLLKDELFSTDDMAGLMSRYQGHHGMAGMLAEARAWGFDFLLSMADDEPDAADELRAAAECFSAEHDLVWAIWEFTGGWISSEEGARKLAQAGTRGRIVSLIRIMREHDARAAQHLENALELMHESNKGATPGRFDHARLEGVPKIGFDIHCSPMPGSLLSVMKYLGDPCDYDYLMGVTGAAFRRLYNRDDGGNVDLMYLAPEPHLRASTALGYDLQLAPFKRERIIRAIKESIMRGRPVIAFGVVGPPEAGIVTGYEQGGDVLLGYSYFQNDPGNGDSVDIDSTGAYHRPDWFTRMTPKAPNAALLIVGDKNRWPGPSRRDILISSLKWAIDLARTAKRPGLPDHTCGLAAYEGWARGLEVDADYPQEDAQVLGWRVMIHGDQCMMLDERHSAARFLLMSIDLAPEAAEVLRAAAALYHSVADEGKWVWPWSCDYGSVQQKLADPATRRELAAHVRSAAEKESQAVALLEQAVALLSRVWPC